MVEGVVETDPIDAIGDDVAGESELEETEVGEASEQETPREVTGSDVEVDEASDEEAAPAESDEDVTEDSTVTDQRAVKEQPAEPFTYQGDHQVHAIDGSKVGADGSVTIPKDQIPHVKNLLASGRYFTGSWQREQAAAKQSVQAANTERDSQKARADALVQKFEELMTLPEDATYEQILQFRQQWPQIQAEAASAGIKAQADADRQKLQQYEAQAQAREMLPKLATGLEDHMLEFTKEDRFTGLAKEDLQAIYNNLWNSRTQNSVFVQHEGQWYVNKPVVEKELMYAARFRRQEAATEKKKTAAKVANKAETVTGKKPPPVLTTKGGPQPKGKVEGSVVDKILKETANLRDQTDAIDDWFKDEDFDI